MIQIKPESYLDVAIALQQAAIKLTQDGSKPSYEVINDMSKEFYKKHKEL